MLHAGETLLEELGIDGSVRKDPLLDNELIILNQDRLSMARVGGSSDAFDWTRDVESRTGPKRFLCALCVTSVWLVLSCVAWSFFVLSWLAPPRREAGDV